LPPLVIRQRLELGGGISVVGFTMEPIAPVTSIAMDRVRVTGFFTASAHTNVDIAVRCVVSLSDLGYVDNYGTDFQPLGQCVWPVSKWETNKFYAESFVVSLPSGLAGRISSVNFTSMPLHQLP
jgi:hypothetical protein